MAKRRVFISPMELDNHLHDSYLQLPADAVHRLLTVLRLTDGAKVEVFDGAGRVFEGVLAKTPQPQLQQLVQRDNKNTGPSIMIAQALVKMDKLEQIAQRSCELGATKLVVYKANRSVVDFGHKSQQRMERLQKIAEDASRQSGRVIVPQVEGVLSFQELALLVHDFLGVVVVGDLNAVELLSQSLEEQQEKLQHGFLMIVGPEGGLTDTELPMLREKGALSVSLSPYVLRTETASLAAIAIAQVVLGNA